MENQTSSGHLDGLQNVGCDITKRQAHWIKYRTWFLKEEEKEEEEEEDIDSNSHCRDICQSMEIEIVRCAPSEVAIGMERFQHTCKYSVSIALACHDARCSPSPLLISLPPTLIPFSSLIAAFAFTLTRRALKRLIACRIATDSRLPSLLWSRRFAASYYVTSLCSPRTNGNASDSVGVWYLHRRIRDFEPSPTSVARTPTRAERHHKRGLGEGRNFAKFNSML